MKRSTVIRGMAATALGVAGITASVMLANGQDTSIRCALLKSAGTVIDRFEYHSPECPPDRTHKDVKFLPAPPVPPPTYDPALQVLEGPTHTIEATQVTESWNVRNKTQQELDAEADAALDAFQTQTLYHALWDVVNTLEALRVHLNLTKQQLDTLKDQNKLTEQQYRTWLKQHKASGLATRSAK